MEAVLDKIIAELLCTDTARIRAATTELDRAYQNPETLPALCQIIVSQREVQLRQFAAVLLNKRLQKLSNWQAVPAEQKESIKSGMLQALIAEKEKPVKTAIASFIGCLVRHEEAKQDSWLAELLNFIFTRCSSEDPKESELGSSIFATLTDAAPDQFISHMNAISEMFASVLLSAEAKGNMTTPTVVNIAKGMSYMIPFVSGNTTAEHTVVKVLPQIMKAVHAFAHKGDEQEFATVFDVVDSLAEYSPKLLNNNVNDMIEFCMETARNKAVDGGIRVQLLTFIGRLVRMKKKQIVKQKLLQPMLTVIFEIMCAETDDENDDYFTGEDSNSPVTAATMALDLLAINMPPEKMIPPLLQLLEPALQNSDPMHRRAAFLSLAVIAEGCSEAICSKYLEVMLNIIKGGIADNVPCVRISSFFALGQFSEHLQPEISKFAPQILPVLFDFLHQLVAELKMGRPEPKHTDRMFYALETYCQNLEEDIVPHLPILMERLFDAMDPSNSVHMRVLALSTISSTAVAAKEHLMPYFPRVVAILQNYLVKEVPEEMQDLRVEAIDTLAAMTRVVGKENFIQFANDTMAYCLIMLEDGPNDPDFKRAIYNLIGSLSTVVNEGMSTVFPNIIDRIIESVISTEDIVPVVEPPTPGSILADQLKETEIDLDNTDDEDDDDDDAYEVENDFVYEKEEAIVALKDFAAHTGAAFAPYLQKAFENVYKVIEHPQDVVRKAAIEALCVFITALHKLQDTDGVKRACAIVMPKFLQIMRTDEEQCVVVHVLELLGELFTEVKELAIPSQQVADQIFTAIKDFFNNKMNCQFNEQSGGGDEEESENSELDEMVIENAGNLFPLFGKAIGPELFAMYFGRMFQFYIHKLKKAKKDDSADQRAFVYGVLADCVVSLRGNVVTYFDGICQVYIDGVTDPEPRARQNCFYGLGELVTNAEEKSFQSFQVILQVLSNAIASETNAAALDNICGAVARLITTNHQMVPLAQVMPVFLANLPLREDTDENDVIQKAFQILYMQNRPIVIEYLERILAITLESLYKKQLTDEDNERSCIAFVKEIRESFPDKFNNVVNSNPEVFKFVQTL